MKSLYVGLGGNQGDRRSALAAATRTLCEWSGEAGFVVSSLYETQYVGTGRQPDYYNACIRLRAPEDLEAWQRRCADLELRAGRNADSHMEPRPLDIDLLCCDDTVLDSPALQLPHPRMAGRRFVLQPLYDIEPDLRWPNCPETVSELLESRVIASQRITQLASGDWWTGADL